MSLDISGVTSGYGDYLKTEENSTASKLAKKLETGYNATSNEELMDACKEFEAYFLEQVFKEMQKTVPESQEESASSSNMVDYFKDNMVQELASQSTEQNSLGLAKMLYEQMKRNYDL